MKLQFYQHIFSSYLIVYINHKDISFFNYTGFIVNNDEGQYMPNFGIHVIANES